MEMNDKKKRQSMFLYILIGLVVFSLLRSFVYPNIMNGAVKEASYSEFLAMVDQGEVEEVEITFTTGEGESRQIYKTTLFPNDATLVERLQDTDVKFSAHIHDETASLFLYLLINLLPLAIFIGGGWFLNRQLRKQMGDDNNMSFGGGFGLGGGLGRSGAKEVKGEETGVTFRDVAGQDEAKESLQEIVGFLKDPGRYAAIGALGRPSGNGKDAFGQGLCRRGQRPVLLHLGLRVRGDVRGARCCQGA